ncbi:hypothetical protein D1O30_13725 [Methylocystis hirsuta]|uniref:Uncharacterized protein n=1 Tax=Methylocystis hirsuta TaxID=369798 RepID=A0A3M9XQH7_9HYPH|nr:hypothetical protein D1O30_13725 [Methylocystis hirsuta]
MSRTSRAARRGGNGNSHRRGSPRVEKPIRFSERPELSQSWMFSKRFRGVAVKPRSFRVMS